jgi:hypothetical protein
MYRAFILATIATIACLRETRAQTPPAAARTVDKRTPATASGLLGTWTGTVIQVQNSIEYKVIIEIRPYEAMVSYPEMACVGMLSRVGTSGEYSFFVETITRGSPDEQDRCANGSVTLARTADNKLAWAWFGLFKEDVVAAYGILARTSDLRRRPADEQEQSITSTAKPAPLPPTRKRAPAYHPTPPQ